MFPRKTVRMNNQESNPEFVDNNPYHSLENSDMETSDHEDTMKTNYRYTRETKTPVPPPIIIKGKPDDHLKFIQDIKNSIGEKFYIKYTKYNTNIYTSSNDNHLKLKEKLISDKREFYTYTIKTDKTHAYIMRGLQVNKIEERVSEELTTIYKVNVKSVVQLKTNYDPLYMVVTGSDVRIIDLSKIKFINHTKVTWERKLNTKKLYNVKTASSGDMRRPIATASQIALNVVLNTVLFNVQWK